MSKWNGTLQEKNNSITQECYHHSRTTITPDRSHAKIKPLLEEKNPITEAYITEAYITKAYITVEELITSRT